MTVYFGERCCSMREAREEGNAQKDWSSWCGGAGKLERDSVVYTTLRALVIRRRAVTDQAPQAPCVTQGESKR